jgi:hypothetical protein
MKEILVTNQLEFTILIPIRLGHLSFVPCPLAKSKGKPGTGDPGKPGKLGTVHSYALP